MREWLRICVMGLAVVFLWSGTLSSARAHEVTPMRLFLVPDEGRSQSAISINNVRNEPLTYEVRALRRVTQPDGAEELVYAEEDFVIFPPQGEVSPGASQSVLLQYVGPPVGDRAASYVVQVVEVPVERPGFSGVRFTYNFGVAVYVEPARAQDKLSVLSVDRTAEGVRMIIRNSGTKYALLNTWRVYLTRGGERIEVTADEIAASGINPLLPPQMDRTLMLALPDLPPEGDLGAELRAQ